MEERKHDANETNQYLNTFGAEPLSQQVDQESKVYNQRNTYLNRFEQFQKDIGSVFNQENSTTKNQQGNSIREFDTNFSTNRDLDTKSSIPNDGYKRRGHQFGIKVSKEPASSSLQKIKEITQMKIIKLQKDSDIREQGKSSDNESLFQPIAKKNYESVTDEPLIMNFGNEKMSPLLVHYNGFGTENQSIIEQFNIGNSRPNKVSFDKDSQFMTGYTTGGINGTSKYFRFNEESRENLVKNINQKEYSSENGRIPSETRTREPENTLTSNDRKQNSVRKSYFRETNEVSYVSEYSQFEKAVLLFGNKEYQYEEKEEYLKSLIEIHKQELKNQETRFSIQLLDKENSINELKQHLKNLNTKSSETIDKITKERNEEKTSSYALKSKYEETISQLKINYQKKLMQRQRDFEDLKRSLELEKQKGEQSQNTIQQLKREQLQSREKALYEIDMFKSNFEEQHEDTENRIQEIKLQMIEENEHLIYNIRKQYEDSRIELLTSLNEQRLTNQQYIFEIERLQDTNVEQIKKIQSLEHQLIEQRSNNQQINAQFREKMTQYMDEIKQLQTEREHQAKIIEQIIQENQQMTQLHQKIQNYEKILYGSVRKPLTKRQSHSNSKVFK